MAKVKIIEIPDKFVSYWDDQAQCVVDHWLDFHEVSIHDVKKVIGNTVIPFINNKKCDVHVIDNSASSGAFSREVAEFFKTEVIAGMQMTGIKYFVTIFSENSPIANISIKSVIAKALNKNFFIIEASSLEDGLKVVSSLKSAKRQTA